MRLNRTIIAGLVAVLAALAVAAIASAAARVDPTWGDGGTVITPAALGSTSADAITQYRLRTVDIDGSSKFSDVRSVRGEGQAGKIILYPNPSTDGTTKVVFEDMSGTRDVSLTDMSGRTIKQWTAVTNNNLEINNITPGYYTLRVINRETGEQSVEKMVVSKR